MTRKYDRTVLGFRSSDLGSRRSAFCGRRSGAGAILGCAARAGPAIPENLWAAGQSPGWERGARARPGMPPIYVPAPVRVSSVPAVWAGGRGAAPTVGPHGDSPAGTAPADRSTPAAGRASLGPPLGLRLRSGSGEALHGPLIRCLVPRTIRQVEIDLPISYSVHEFAHVLSRQPQKGQDLIITSQIHRLLDKGVPPKFTSPFRPGLEIYLLGANDTGRASCSCNSIRYRIAPES